MMGLAALVGVWSVLNLATAGVGGLFRRRIVPGHIWRLQVFLLG